MPLKKYLDYDGLAYLLTRFPRTKIVITCSSEFAGSTITCTKGSTTYSETCPVTEPYQVSFAIGEIGLWTISCEYAGTVYTSSVTVIALGGITYGTLTVTPNGSTVETLNDVPIWIKCAAIQDKDYGSLMQVIQDEQLLDALLSDSNAVNYLARCTGFIDAFTSDAYLMMKIGQYDYCARKLLANEDWAEAIANSDYIDSVLDVSVPKMTSNTAPSGTCIGSGANSGSALYYAFDKNESTQWAYTGSYPMYIGYTFTSAVCCKAMKFISTNGDNEPKEYKVQGSNDGFVSDIHDLLEVNISAHEVSGTKILNNNNAYTSYRILISTAWTSGAGSIYKELNFYGREDKTYIPLVPVMTSDTAPRGEAISTDNGGGVSPYMVFDNNLTTLWGSNNGTRTAGLGYEFESAVSVRLFKIIKEYYTSGTSSANIQYSDDGTIWNNAFESDFTFTHSSSEQSFVVPDRGLHKYWRLYETTTNNSVAYYELQFYTSGTDVIHSAVNDAIYYVDGGQNIPVAYTGENGIGACNFSDLAPGNYTLYSSVAKDPNDLTKPYSKQVTITESNYGSTTEVWLMPEGVMYWYGNTCDWLTGGYEPHNINTSSGYVCTWDTDHLSFKINSGGSANVTTKKTFNSRFSDKLYGVSKQTTGGASIISSTTDTTPQNSSYGRKVLSSQNVLSTEYVELTGYGDVYSSFFMSMATGATGIGNLYAMWYNILKPSQLYSAANDTVYIIEDGSPVVVATTDSTGKATLNSMLEPGTYTFFSSVAKDPDSLSNDYHKTITISSGTKDIKVMPDGAFYWYGWRSNNISVQAQAYKASSSSATCTACSVINNTNDITFQGTTNSYSSFAISDSVLKNNASKLKCITLCNDTYDGQTFIALISNYVNNFDAIQYVFVSGQTTFALKEMNITTAGYNICTGRVYSPNGYTRQIKFSALWYE